MIKDVFPVSCHDYFEGKIDHEFQSNGSANSSDVESSRMECHFRVENLTSHTDAGDWSVSLEEDVEQSDKQPVVETANFKVTITEGKPGEKKEGEEKEEVRDSTEKSGPNGNFSLQSNKGMPSSWTFLVISHFHYFSFSLLVRLDSLE